MKFDRHRLITRRSRLNYTQEDLAGLAGVAVRSVAGWESGETQPTVRMLQKLADALGVPPGWFLGDNAHISIDPKPRREMQGGDSKEVVGRILRRLSELSNIERMRIEPIILSLIDAVIALRSSQNLSVDEIRAGIAAAHKAAGLSEVDVAVQGNEEAERRK